MKPFVVIVVAAVLLSVLTHVASAQLPTATGRALDLSTAGYKLFIPSNYQHRPGEATDLLVHFHGDPQTVWNNAKYANLNAVVLTVNLGTVTGHYQSPYLADTTLFGDVMAETLAKVRAESDFADSAAWDKVAVASFSAGSGAVREILKQSSYVNEIDAVVAEDTIYAGFANGTSLPPTSSHMAPWRSFALLAKSGSKTFVLTHSQVLTYTYANTIETADDILASIGVTATPYSATGLGSLPFYRYAHSGNFTMYGATGGDAPAHSKHLQYSGQFLDEVPLATVPEPGGALVIALMTASLALRRRRFQ